MNLDFSNVYENVGKIVKDNTINLSSIDFIDSWAIVLVCLILIEKHQETDKSIILPKNENSLKYLRRMHFGDILRELGYQKEADELDGINVSERMNLSIHEIMHCKFRDEFDARLGRFLSIFRDFGLNEDDAKRATSLVGELGNNVFDHNLGTWPTDVSGCIIMAQKYPNAIDKRVEVVVGDPGVGFFGSLKNAYPELEGDLDAIKKGLGGFTGRIGERRGNGLRLIQNWTINNFSGRLNIQSGEGLVTVEKDGAKERVVHRILGTLAQFVIYYK